MKKTLKIIGIVVGSLLIIVISFAAIKGILPLSLSLHSSVYQSNGHALDGYDVVSYFEGSPVTGNEAHAMEWEGTTWLFASVDHLEAFKAQPEKYVPQFGGYCTFAVSTGFTAPADPSVWLIHNDKLYVFSDEKVKKAFMADPNEIISACSKEWR